MVFPASDLSQENILRDVHDPVNQNLRVNADITIGSVTVDDIIIRDATNGSNKLKVNSDGTIDANVIVSQTSDSIRLGDGTSLVTSTTIGPKQGLDVNVAGGVVTGDFTSSGLKTSIKASKMTITDVAQALPLSPLTDRNTISVRVMGDKTVYFGSSAVTSALGYPKFQFEEIFMDIKDNPSVQLYAICATGETCEVRIMEIA